MCNLFKRTYAETLSSAPYVLDTPVSAASPDVVVTPSGYTATLTVTDADKNTLYDGGVTGFRSYLFEENGHLRRQARRQGRWKLVRP